jgi:hypothetical protein
MTSSSASSVVWLIEMNRRELSSTSLLGGSDTVYGLAIDGEPSLLHWQPTIRLPMDVSMLAEQVQKPGRELIAERVQRSCVMAIFASVFSENPQPCVSRVKREGRMRGRFRCGVHDIESPSSTGSTIRMVILKISLSRRSGGNRWRG